MSGSGRRPEVAPGQRRAAADERRAARGLLWAALAVGLAAGLPLLLLALRDPGAIERWLAAAYELAGLDGQAGAIRDRGMHPLAARVAPATIAVLAGVGGVWALFGASNAALDALARPRWRERLRPLLFVGPAVAMVSAFLVLPVAGTIATSLGEDGGALANYRFALTDPAMHVAFRNNVLWLVLGTGGSVGIGLAIAGLVDRVKREALAKTFVFLPMAISFVGASVIWRFVYAWRPEGADQIGVLNAGLTAAGFDPVPFLQTPAPLNTLALIAVMVWLQTGFAMVILSAAVKGVPGEVVEAARIDGAGELQLFFRIVVPMIRPTILTVATTVFIVILKVFDIVFVTTGGRHGTEVVANRMFSEMFRYRNFGQASALAVVLLVAVVPVMVVNVRNLRRQGVEQ